MNLLISEAFASSSAVHQNNPYSFICMLLFFVAIFYFIIFRPQKNKIKAHRALIDSLSKDDEVLTTSGFIGKIKNITKQGYILLVLNDNVEVLIKSDYISLVLPKNTIKKLDY
ncbi:MAG: preprotein translocase subunit YajC [Buchnera aphidicola (Kaburagia rhusicola rhusicola)]